MDDLKYKISFAFSELIESFLLILPKLLVALFLVMAGWVFAKLLKSWICKIMGPLFGWIGRRIGKFEEPGSDLERKATGFVGHLVFWVTWLCFGVGAIQLVAKPVALTGFELLVQFLPRLLAAALIFFGGWIFGSLFQRLVKKALISYGDEQATAFGRVSKNAILFFTLLLVFNQLGFRVDLIIQLSIIFVAMLAGSFSLAFALGAKATIGHMMASHYILKNFKIGQRVKIGEVEGKIMNMSRTQVVIDTVGGLVFIPARDFNNKWVAVLKE
jgi:phage pi2 protein 07